jgi:ABC-type transport system involved in multi-copper enzyme maturation permease subunit
VAVDVGLGVVGFFGSVTAIVLGVSLLYNEVQRRTIHTIVSKPLARFEFVLGKYAGMAMMLTVLVAAFAFALAVVVAVRGGELSSAVPKAILLTYLEVLVVAALAVFFSAFSSPFLSGVFSFALYFMGQVTPEMRDAVASPDLGALRDACRAALYVIPDLHLFSISGGEVRGEHVTVHGEFVDWSYLVTAIGYGGFWIALLLALAILIFSRRDFV